MRKAEIITGADAYYVSGEPWRILPPTRATIVDPASVRIVRKPMGAVYLVGHVPDPTWNAIVVDLHESTGVRRTAVRVRELRGLWAPTLAATNRTEEGVALQRAAITALARRPGPITGADLLDLAANHPHLPDDVFVALAPAAEGRTAS
jgi:hypothetical protein